MPLIELEKIGPLLRTCVEEERKGLRTKPWNTPIFRTIRRLGRNSREIRAEQEESGVSDAKEKDNC